MKSVIKHSLFFIWAITIVGCSGGGDKGVGGQSPSGTAVEPSGSEAQAVSPDFQNRWYEVAEINAKDDQGNNISLKASDLRDLSGGLTTMIYIGSSEYKVRAYKRQQFGDNYCEASSRVQWSRTSTGWSATVQDRQEKKCQFDNGYLRASFEVGTVSVEVIDANSIKMSKTAGDAQGEITLVVVADPSTGPVLAKASTVSTRRLASTETIDLSWLPFKGSTGK